MRNKPKLYRGPEEVWFPYAFICQEASLPVTLEPGAVRRIPLRIGDDLRAPDGGARGDGELTLRLEGKAPRRVRHPACGWVVNLCRQTDSRRAKGSSRPGMLPRRYHFDTARTSWTSRSRTGEQPQPSPRSSSAWNCD